MATQTATHTKTSRQLDELLGEAHASAYRLPADFPGFAATLSMAGAGWRALGSLRANGPERVEVTVDAPEAERAWAARELTSMVAHRWHQPYEACDGRLPKATDDEVDHPLGRLVRLDGDPYSSSYRVLDGHVSVVERHMGPMRFCIVVHERAPAPERRSVPSTFTVTYWNAATGALSRTDAYRDVYTEVEGVLLPASRRVVTASDDGLVARQLRLSDLRVLAGAAS
jgi:hypothetical protein